MIESLCSLKKMSFIAIHYRSKKNYTIDTSHLIICDFRITCDDQTFLII